MIDLLHNGVQYTKLFSPQNPGSGDTAIVSSIIDTANYNGVELVISYGSISDANVTFTVLVEDGDNSALSDNAAVSDANLLGTEALATPLFSNDNVVTKIGYIGPKRYLRVTVTPSGNTGDIYISGIAALAGARVKPKTTQLA